MILRYLLDDSGALGDQHRLRIPMAHCPRAGRTLHP